MNPNPKTLLLLLSISLGLNLFFAGAWAGRRFMGPGRGGFREPFGVSAFLRHSGLENSDSAVKQVIDAHRKGVRERMRALGAARNEVQVALQADTFDAARLEQTLQALKTATGDLQTEMQAALLEVSRSLTAEQRKRMANALWPHSRFGHRPDLGF